MFNRVLLVFLYGLILPLKLVQRVLRRDPMLLREPEGCQSFWLKRRPITNKQSYFSQASEAEGKPAEIGGSGRSTSPGAASLIVPIFKMIAKAQVASSDGNKDVVTHGQDREHGIPDEIYTLW